MMIYASVPSFKRKKKPKNVTTDKKVVLQSSKKRLSTKHLDIPSDRITPNYKSNDSVTLGAMEKSGIMRNFDKLSQDDRKIVEKIANCLAPLHKGNYVYVSEGINPASLGRKNEVL
jgi:hypothetical protein